MCNISAVSTTSYKILEVNFFNDYYEQLPSNHQDTGWLIIIIVRLWVVEVYQICIAYF
jgi:hypothetical protein